ncbi:cytochrome P450 1A1-like [Watersipora subatra]|uniref:cytochrome P450 1A1-like n=1 Tax=Watersipora subatra TaxID=2589382 RepID=UPI00355B657D
MEFTSSHLAVLVISVLSYVLYKRWKDPLRKIPGPKGLPLLGNTFSIKPEQMHVQLYDIAKKYGAVTKISLFNTPIVILNSTEACLEALIKKGTDFQGRPPLPRMWIFNPKSLAAAPFEHPDYSSLHRVAVTGLKSYGSGVAELERIMETTVAETIDLLQGKDGQPVDTHELSNGYIGCVMASILFGERYSYDDPICKSIHEMNDRLIQAIDPYSSGAILDIFPFLINFPFLFKYVHENIAKSQDMLNGFIMARINEAKASFETDQKRGCLDYFVEAHRNGVNGTGHKFDDDCIKGLVIDFIAGGMETSLSSISQTFLDLLHDQQLQKRLQAELDSQFEPTQTITMKDKNKLPLLSAYVLENLRYMNATPFLIPHFTLKDTEVAGYQIPANTRVLINAYYIAHNPDIYPEPFEIKPERFLDEDGKVVEAGHPSKHNLLTFGAGRRICPGELLAKSRIFLLLANILHKFDLQPVGELPDRDVRKYKLGILLSPPHVTARFVRRQ